MEHYRFETEMRANEQGANAEVKAHEKSERGIILGADITVVGSLNETNEHNLEQYGRYIAERIARATEQAEKSGKKLVFDMATGSTPKAVWPELRKLNEQGKVNISNIIIIGHEEAWGPYEAGSHSDFDAYRRGFLQDNNAPIQELRSPEQVAEPVLEGNFVPMHLEDVARSSFPEGEQGDKSYLEAEEQASQNSAHEYGKIVRALEERDDTVFFGLYGVGTDGHIGEMQIDTMGVDRTLQRRDTYADPIEDYSVENGLFYWQKDDSGFYPESNIFWQRGAREGEAVGRAAWQGYTDIHEVVGIGWRDLLREDEMLLAFNNAGKSLTFQLALEGSLTGMIKNEQGDAVIPVKRDKGEGEAVLPDLETYARTLESEGLLDPGTVDKNSSSANPLKCHGLFEAIYLNLNRVEAGSDDLRYQEMWKFANRYIGKRAPVARLVRMRSLLGKKTELVATPDVVQGTKYETLARLE